MDNTVTYEWSEELSKASQLAFYKTRIGRPGLAVAGGLLICVLGWVSEYFSLCPRLPMGILCTFFGLLLVIAPLRLYGSVRRLARDAVRLSGGDLKVAVTITHESIGISSAKATRTLEWNRMTRLREVDGFLLLFVGKLLVASLPREPFSAEQVEFIRNMMNKQRSSSDRSAS